MKIEIPKTIWMLAGGCLLLFAAQFSNRIDTATAFLGRHPKQPDWQKNVRATSQRVEQSIVANEKLDGRQLLLQSANQIFRADSFRASARLHVNLFDQQMTADGQYHQLGEARGSRLEFAYGDSSEPSTIQQIGDGQFHYLYEATGKQAKLRVANLLALAEADEQRLFGEIFNWKSQGGLAHLLANLADSFQFQEVSPSSIGDTPVLVVKGSWNEDRLRRYLHGQTNPDFIRNQIQWEKLPQHLPRTVEIVLGNDSYFPLFPYRISYFRPDDAEQGGRDVNIATIELYELELNVELPEELFRVESGSTQLDDVTPRQVNRIRGLNDAVRSARFNLKNNRKR